MAQDRPDGTQVGAFFLTTDVTAGVGFDDNVYAQNTVEVDDVFYTLEPTLTLASGWSVHSLELSFANENAWYSDTPGEDYHHWQVGGNGRLDVTRVTAIHLRALYASESQSRENPDDFAILAERTEFDRVELGAELRHRFNRITARLGGGYESQDYDDATAFGGGTLDNDARDISVWEIFGLVGVDISPDTRVFVRGIWNDREHDQSPPTVPVNRDSTGFSVVAGAEFGATERLEGEVYIGYFEQDYDTLVDVDGISFGASLAWFATPLTTVILNASRSVEDTQLVGATAYVQSDAGVSVQHELLRQLHLEAGLSYQDREFEGITRNEDGWALEFGADYNFYRNLSLVFDYTMRSRSSDVVALDYDRQTVWAGLSGRF